MAPLPKWKPRRTLIDLYNERDRTRWYWRSAATLSSFMIMIGFLVFPSSFDGQTALTVEQNTAGIAAILLLALGYTLSVALWFLCQSWLFQLDVIFLPCLATCVFGLFNTVYNLKIHKPSPHWTSSSISALALATISTVIYAILALLTFRKVHIVRSRDAMHRHTPDGESIHLLPEDEQQRQQLMGLLVQRDTGKKVSPEASQSTFRIDLPDSLRRSATHLTAPQNIYEGHSRNYPTPLDRPAYPAAAITVTNPTVTTLDSHPMHHQPLDASLDPAFAHMEGHLAPGRDVGPDHNVPNLVTTRYPNEKALPSYGGGGVLLIGGERHPLERERAQYRMETEEEQEQRRRSASRESRRAEIEMSGRVKAGGRAEMEGVEVSPRIARVETDGWGRKGAQ